MGSSSSNSRVAALGPKPDATAASDHHNHDGAASGRASGAYAARRASPGKLGGVVAQSPGPIVANTKSTATSMSYTSRLSSRFSSQGGSVITFGAASSGPASGAQSGTVAVYEDDFVTRTTTTPAGRDAAIPVGGSQFRGTTRPPSPVQERFEGSDVGSPPSRLAHLENTVTPDDAPHAKDGRIGRHAASARRRGSGARRDGGRDGATGPKLSPSSSRHLGALRAREMYRRSQSSMSDAELDLGPAAVSQPRLVNVAAPSEGGQHGMAASGASGGAAQARDAHALLSRSSHSATAPPGAMAQSDSSTRGSASYARGPQRASSGGGGGVAGARSAERGASPYSSMSAGRRDRAGSSPNQLSRTRSVSDPIAHHDSQGDVTGPRTPVLSDAAAMSPDASAMLTAISEAHRDFLDAGVTPQTMFLRLNNHLLEFSNSAYGFIAELGSDPSRDGAPYLRMRALTDVEWGFQGLSGRPKSESDSRVAGAAGAAVVLDDVVFSDMDTLLGEAAITQRTVIANFIDADARVRRSMPGFAAGVSGGSPVAQFRRPRTDPASAHQAPPSPSADRRSARRERGIPPGMHSFMGIPFFHGDECLGIVGIANRPGGYGKQVETELQPLLATIASLLRGFRADMARAQAEMELHDANATLHRRVAQRTAKLERALQARSAFLGKISHELRSPLHGVVGNLDLLAQEPMSPVQQDLVGTIMSSSHTLLTLLDSLLDFSKLEAGKLFVEWSHADVGVVLANAAALFTPLGHEHGVDVGFTAPSLFDPAAGRRARTYSSEVDLGSPLPRHSPSTMAHTPRRPHRGSAGAAAAFVGRNVAPSGVIVHTDPVRLGQICSNLVSNAIKFADSRVQLVLSTWDPHKALDAAAAVAASAAGEGDRAPRSQRSTPRAGGSSLTASTLGSPSTAPSPMATAAAKPGGKATPGLCVYPYDSAAEGRRFSIKSSADVEARWGAAHLSAPTARQVAVLIECVDDGPGIDDADQVALFDAFVQGSDLDAAESIARSGHKGTRGTPTATTATAATAASSTDLTSSSDRLTESSTGVDKSTSRARHTRTTSTRAKTAGTGLGLAITREIAGLLGGCVIVQSAVGHGTSFGVLVPMEIVSVAAGRVASAATAEASASDTEGAPARVVPASARHSETKAASSSKDDGGDDSDSSGALARAATTATKAGTSVSPRSSRGMSGSSARSLTVDTSPEKLARADAVGGPRRRTPGVSASQHARLVSSSSSASAGLSPHAQAVSRLHGASSTPDAKRSPGGTAVAASVAMELPHEQRQLRYLAVDDNKVNRKIVAMQLSKLGIPSDNVQLATNGKEALDAYTDLPPDRRPSVILMDLSMPVMEGPEATKLILQVAEAAGHALPAVVALTANVFAEAECSDSGFAAFLTKPTRMSQLRACICSVTELEEGASDESGDDVTSPMAGTLSTGP